ncbi:monocarboxylate transporter 6 isoform X1 [Octodon degus]|uniref:Monocarboxylate transporter 6 isoform X1 n=1 Tax=Octodon degus TaxID=10160 RepID=A0A6P6ECM9_OCTDE|nr:monocarboxylate transporter 6 isoform X1 [Octodon degus]
MSLALEHADGSWSWMVLLASLVTQALTASFPACIGIFFADLQRDFQANNSEISWFPSILGAMLQAGGPLCSILVQRYGCRVTMMIGGLLASLGMVASSFCYSLSQFYLTAGMITGLGMSFSFQSSITVLGLYFVRRRALANALASMGISLGVSLWPPFARYLLENLGWRGSFLIFGGVLLHCCVAGAIIRPVAPIVPKTKEDPPLPSKTPAQGCLAACVSAVQHHLAFDILRHNAAFCIYTLGVTWVFMGLSLPQIFMVPYAVTHGVEEYRAALLVSTVGFCNIFLRPVAALVTGRPYFARYRKYLFTLALVFNGLTNLVCALSANFWVLIGYCLVYSVSMCVIGIFLFQVLMEIVPMDRFPSALGLFSIITGIAALVSLPLAGLVLDTTGNFSYVFYLSAFFLTSAGLFMTGGFYYVKKKEEKGTQLKAVETISETSLIQGPESQEGKDSSKEQPPPEIVTSV